MRVITCTGYYGTGSSAVTDLTREYENVACKTDYELHFLFQYHGVNDLYHYLVEKTDWWSMLYAISDYEKLCRQLATSGTKMNYEKYFEGTFLEASEEYIDRIGREYYIGHTGAPADPIGNLTFRLINKIFQVVTLKKYPFVTIGGHRIKIYKNPVTDAGEFTLITRQYINQILSRINTKDFLFIDQLCSASSIEECSRWFDDLKVVVVDRDPRDQYILCNYVWAPENSKHRDDVHDFCESFLRNRHLSARCRGENILRIHFEDLLAHYEETVERIEDFCGLDAAHHVNRLRYFDPKVSINNTRLWLYRQGDPDIRYIEEHLKDYLYNGWSIEDLRPLEKQPVAW